MSATPTFRIAGAAGERAAEAVRARVADRRARGILDPAEIEKVAKISVHAFDGDDAAAEIFRRCCVTWEIDRSPKITSHRRLLGVVIVAAKKLLHRLLRFEIEVPLSRQRDFNWNLLLLLREMRERDARAR